MLLYHISSNGALLDTSLLVNTPTRTIALVPISVVVLMLMGYLRVGRRSSGKVLVGDGGSPTASIDKYSCMWYGSFVSVVCL